MATPEFPMFVTKRTLAFDVPVPGFYAVPAATRTALLAAGAASDTFNAFAVVDNTAPEPPDPEPEARTTRRTTRK